MTAERICVHVKIAVFFCLVRAAIAAKAAQKASPTKNAPIFAAGFPLTKNFVPAAKANQKNAKKPPLQKLHLIIYLISMDNRPVLFIDSGIGSLPYCRDFKERNPQEAICCIADRENFPYGSRTKEEITLILTASMKNLIKTVDPKIAVLACNSATVSAIDSLRGAFPQIPFVGTVPAVKPAANASKSRKVGVLGTARTIEDPYNQILAGKICEILGIAAPDLVEFVEHHLENADENEKNKIVKKYIELFRAEGADTIVLGCTHFLYLLEEFRHSAAPDINIFDSLNGITKRIEFLLDENNGILRAEKDFAPARRLLLTGNEPPDSLWHKRSKSAGLDLCLLCEV